MRRQQGFRYLYCRGRARMPPGPDVTPTAATRPVGLPPRTLRAPRCEMRPMRRHAFALVLLLTTLPATAADWIGQLADSDKHAVEAAAVQADANWNARDAAGLAAMYADDATLVVGGGALAQGQAAVLAYFTASFA